jgi:hypothetical protein
VATSTPSCPIDQQALDAGPDHLIVVDQPTDLSSELAPCSILGAIRASAARRAAA